VLELRFATYTPLIVALKHGKTNVINFLLDQRAVDVYKQCPAYATPLVAAVYFNNLYAVKQLIAIEKVLHGSFDPKKHPGLLVTAVRNDVAEMIEYLLSEGVDINDAGYENFSENDRHGFSEVYDDPTPFDMHDAPVFTLPVIVAMYERKETALVTLLKHHPDMSKKDHPDYGSSVNDVIAHGGSTAEFFKTVCKTHNISGYTFSDTKHPRLFSDAPAQSSTSAALDWGTPIYRNDPGNTSGN